MREADFGTVHGAVADGFDQSQGGMVPGIKYYPLHGCLGEKDEYGNAIK